MNWACQFRIGSGRTAKVRDSHNQCVLGVAASRQRGAEGAGGDGLGELASGHAHGDASSAGQPDVRDGRPVSCHAMISSTVCPGLFMSCSCVMVVVRPIGAWS